MRCKVREEPRRNEGRAENKRAGRAGPIKPFPRHYPAIREGEGKFRAGMCASERWRPPGISRISKPNGRRVEARASLRMYRGALYFLAGNCIFG